jgi:hypothetical protein
MKISTLWFSLKLVFVSFYTPIGFALVPAIAFIPIGIWGYFIDGCSNLNACFINPMLNVYGDQKFFRLLILSWGIGLVMVVAMAYQNFKPDFHAWFRKFK